MTGTERDKVREIVMEEVKDNIGLDLYHDELTDTLTIKLLWNGDVITEDLVQFPTEGNIYLFD